jgi:hypothetical protein
MDTPELLLLFACARTSIDGEAAARIASLAGQDLDWNLLLQLASQHRVGALVYRHLSAVCPDAAPRAALDTLRQHYQADARRSLYLTGELMQLLDLLAVHKIAAIPYKGPALASAVYGNLALREFADLDMLFHKRDVPRVIRLLTEQGFRFELGRVPFDITSKDHYHYRMIRERGWLNIELHWAFTRRYWSFPLDLEALGDRTVAVQVGGKTLRSFRPEDLLLILSAHGAQHFWSRLAWICDIAELVRVYPDLGWTELLAEADRLGVRRILLLGLALAHDLLDARLPEPIAAAIAAAPVIETLVQQIRARLGAHADDVMHGVDARVFYFNLRERRRDRMQYLLHHLLSYGKSVIVPAARERELIPFPPALMPLYHLFWPVRRSIALVSGHAPAVAERDEMRYRRSGDG